MKKIFIFTVLSVVSAIFSAFNTLLASELVLEKRSYGGYVREENMGHENGVRIYDDGKVILFSRSSQMSPLKENEVTSLAVDVLQTMQSNIEMVQKGELRDQSPGVPLCEDAVSTDYALFRQDRSKLLFARRANCHQYLIADPQAKQLMETLDTFSRR